MKKDETSQKIVSAALELISQKGYLGATTKEIAQKAGFTELTLFRHFGSKENLFENVCEECFKMQPEINQILVESEGMPLDATLKAVGEYFYKSLRERKSIIRIMFSEINLYPEKIREIHSFFIDKLIETLTKYFSDLKEKKELRDVPSQLASDTFLGSMYAFFIVEEILKGNVMTEKEIDDSVTGFVDLFLYGLIKNKLKNKFER